MEINKQLVRKHFDRHAHEYDLYAKIQLDMAEKLMELLRQSMQLPASAVRHILEIGCGTGFLTALLVEYFPQAHVTAIDISAKMIDITRDKLKDKSARVSFIEGDAEELLEERQVPAGTFDLIVSNAAFQWFNHVECTLTQLQSCLTNQGKGVIAFSTFVEGTFQELHASYRAAEVALGMPAGVHGSRLLSMAEWKKLCGAEGAEQYRFPYAIHWEWTMECRTVHFPSVKEFLYSVKRIGAGNAVKSRDTLSFSDSKRLFMEMERYYRAHYQEGEYIYATYQMGYGVLKRLDTVK